MKIGILGTGIVGRTNAARLVQLGNEVCMGTRDVSKALSRSEKDAMGNPALRDWLKMNPKIKLETFTEAAKQGELVINAVKGEHAIEALRSAGEANLNGKILIDISNPLDFSKGMPPKLLVSNDDSLGEQIQRTFPKVRVVKTLNTVNAILQTEPTRLSAGNHDIFVAGNDQAAKDDVVKILNQYGWKNVIDLGDISASRGMEMMLIIWVRLMGRLETPMFNFHIVT